MSLHPRSAAGVAAAVAVAAIALAGCANGSASTADGSAAPAAPAASTAATAQPTSAGTTAATEADRILATFAPPSGAHRLTSVADAQKLLAAPLSGPATPNQVDRVQFWSVTGTPAAVTKAVPKPSGATTSFSTAGGAANGSAVGVTFGWPATSVLDTRELQVAAASGPSGTVLRVDAIVTWLPSRPANTLIPATVTSVTMDTTPGIVRAPGQDTHAYHQVTSNDAATVRGIVTALNSAPVQQPGGYHCPMDTGAHMMLSFRHDTSGAVDARATIGTSGCSLITVSVTGGGTVTLTGGRDVGAKVAALLHVPWTSPS
jgi:hypothetical protein